MNAPVQVSEPLALGDVDDFAEVCDQQSWFFAEGWITLSTAVDNLQTVAERWGLIDEIGQDAVQSLMSDAFGPAPDLPSDYVSQLVKQWELADLRDRWKHTGGLPPAPIEEKAKTHPVRVPQATIDAFKYVVGHGDPDYLAKWLRNHSDVAPALVEEVA